MEYCHFFPVLEENDGNSNSTQARLRPLSDFKRPRPTRFVHKGNFAEVLALLMENGVFDSGLASQLFRGLFESMADFVGLSQFGGGKVEKLLSAFEYLSHTPKSLMLRKKGSALSDPCPVGTEGPVDSKSCEAYKQWERDEKSSLEKGILELLRLASYSTGPLKVNFHL